VVLLVALAEGCGAGAVDAEADALAEGWGAVPPVFPVAVVSEPLDWVATDADSLGSGSLEAEGEALEVAAGVAKPAVAISAL
jgi:hypothetical protein